MDCSPAGFSVHGISQARILEWVSISFSRGSSRPSDPIHLMSFESPALVGGFFTTNTTWDLLSISPFFPGGFHNKEFTCNAGDLGLIPVYCQGCILSPCLFNLCAELDEAQAGVKIAGRNINNLRYADDTTLTAESEELKSLLMKVKEESEKVGHSLFDALISLNWVSLEHDDESHMVLCLNQSNANIYIAFLDPASSSLTGYFSSRLDA